MTRYAAAFALLFTVPFVANAADLSYDYLEVGWHGLDGAGDHDTDGWSAGGSVAFSPNLHAFGSYARDKSDHFGYADALWRVGLGWNTSLSDRSDLVVRGSYIQSRERSGPPPRSSSSGFEAEVGMRSAFGEHVETYVGLGFMDLQYAGTIDLTDGSGDVYGKLGGQYKFTPTFGIVAQATLLGGGNEYFVGPRLSF